MAFATSHIPEKAAIPKDIYILPELPVTAVDKVFKPELEKREINKKITKEIEAVLSNSQFTVHVVQNPMHGLLAEIQLHNCTSKAAETVDRRLGGYTFKYTVSQ